MARLRHTRGELLLATRAHHTIAGYSSDWSQFNAWCIQAGRSALPASQDTLAMYVTWVLTERGRKVTTAERHASAVAHYHRRAGYPIPLGREVRQILLSVRRQRKERPQGKAALQINDLLRVVLACDAATNIGTRDRALIVLGFATSLRRSELARLEAEDISFADEGLAVIVRHSKTDQMGRGRVIGVWAGQRESTDPVRVLKEWLVKRGEWKGPLFARVTHRGDVVTRLPISGEAINEVVKRAIGRAGLDPKLYGAHSLRAGAVTAAAEIGGTDQEIMGLSGHASAVVMRTYVRRARIFSGRNPLAGVL